MLRSRDRIAIGLLALAIAALGPAAAGAAVTPLTGLYEGTDSAGGKISFTVADAPPGSNPPQEVRLRSAGSYSSICTPWTVLFGPLLAGGCKGGPFPDPPPAGLPLVTGEVSVKGVYADATANQDNDAAFNGTLSAAARIAPLADEEGSAQTVPYPQLSWRAVLVDPAAVATPLPGGARVANGVARLPVRCQARGVPSCSVTVTLRGGPLSHPVSPRVRVPDGARRDVAVRLPASFGASSAQPGAEPIEVSVTSGDHRTRTVERRATVTLSPSGSGR